MCSEIFSLKKKWPIRIELLECPWCDWLNEVNGRTENAHFNSSICPLHLFHLQALICASDSSTSVLLFSAPSVFDLLLRFSLPREGATFADLVLFAAGRDVSPPPRHLAFLNFSHLCDTSKNRETAHSRFNSIIRKLLKFSQMARLQQNQKNYSIKVFVCFAQLLLYF
jgi:hypothetical protein